MAKISQETIRDVIESNDIVDIISSYVRLKRAGKEYRGLCPFHSEKTPSFYVDAERQVYYCFGCHSGGNVISFIMNIEGLNFIDAVKFLADKAGIIIKEDAADDRRSILYEINREAARFYYENLKSKLGVIAYSYLKNRGIEDKTIVKFGLGYSYKEWDSLLKYLSKKGYEIHDIERAGLIIKSKDGNSYFDRYRNRVMFPIIDSRNNIIGFGARSIDDSMPKYLNSPETEIFNKSSVLYGLNFAKKSRSDHFILVEGYMDVISLHQAGIDYAVASLGTALTPKHVELMRRYKNSVILAYDADTAGKMATDRGLDLLEKAHLDIKVLEVPSGKDPDEFVRSAGVEAFKETEKAAMPFVQYRLEKARSGLNLDNPEEKALFVGRASDVLADIEDEVKLDSYIKYVSELTGIDEPIIKAHIIKKVKSKNQQNKNIEYISGNNRHNINYENNDANNAINSLISETERNLLALLINNYQLRQKYMSVLDESLFSYPFGQNLFLKLRDMALQNENIDGIELMSQYQRESEIQEISKILSTHIDQPVEKAFMEALLTLKREKLKKAVSELTANINQCKDINIIKKLQQEVLNIKKELVKLSIKKSERRGQNG